jgi:2-keto-3-deoxy-L-rhamnonate aldolase RhmA
VKARLIIAATIVSAASIAAPAAAQHLNPLVDLLAAKKPVFGLYAPANPRAGRGGRGGPPGAQPTTTPQVVVAPPAQKTPAELAKDAITHSPNDYIFDGSMEGVESFDRSYETFGEFVKGLAAAGSPAERWKHPLAVKMHEIAPDPEKAKVNIGRQLNLGVASVVFVGVESAEEVKTGLAAMRFKSKGGTRPDDVGEAPAFWGLSEKEYKEKADVWPLNPRGELVNFTIVESKPGLEKIREIAAVKGIGVLFPGAGTLGGVFSRIDSTVTPPRRIRDDVAWENAIQSVLSACKEFNVPCGFPANTPDVMEMRYKQGFSVFVIGWGDNGFKTVDAGVALRK